MRGELLAGLGPSRLVRYAKNHGGMRTGQEMRSQPGAIDDFAPVTGEAKCRSQQGLSSGGSQRDQYLGLHQRRLAVQPRPAPPLDIWNAS